VSEASVVIALYVILVFKSVALNVVCVRERVVVCCCCVVCVLCGCG
jgi:hypothetical protein